MLPAVAECWWMDEVLNIPPSLFASSVFPHDIINAPIAFNDTAIDASYYVIKFPIHEVKLRDCPVQSLSHPEHDINKANHRRNQHPEYD